MQQIFSDQYINNAFIKQGYYFTTFIGGKVWTFCSSNLGLTGSRPYVVIKVNEWHWVNSSFRAPLWCSRSPTGRGQPQIGGSNSTEKALAAQRYLKYYEKL